MMMGRRGIVGLIAGCLSLLLSACGGSDASFRYRLSFSVSANGVAKSGSSIISVRYWRGGASWGTGEATYTVVKGVAPVIDLGQYGMLVAAMAYDVDAWTSRKVCKPPLPAESLPGKFRLEPAALAALRGGKLDLGDDSYPAFIWFPAGQPYEQAQQLCPEEFSSVIGANIELQSVTIEAAPDAPLLTRLEIKAPWLDEIRIDQKTNSAVYSKSGIFKPNRTRMIETDGI
ncbi:MULTISPECIES: hypothetical protein [unclassified Bradyrhizobium]|uniref:hypothetical protein n=1 Tax=unclassified Bradyrhizobium TaxID=2631580 RepID=UPI0024E104F5|nr:MULTISPECIES: hypothetical protein [unclassified Bradyrhizobium]